MAIDQFSCNFTNVLSDTKSINIIISSIFLVANIYVCLCLLEVIKVMHFEIILGCMYR